MLKLRLAVAAAIVAAATLMTAGAAQAYPDPTITIDVNGKILVGGNTFTYKASASVDCIWTVTYADGHAPGTSPTQTGAGKSISGKYDTKVVSKTFKSPITAECKYDDAVAPAVVRVTSTNTVTPAFYSSSPSTALQTALQTASASATITLLPTPGPDDGDDSSLPDTGGSSLYWLIIGGALVAVGAGVAYAARRRHSSH